MRMYKDQIICGIPIKEIRDFLRKYKVYTIDALVNNKTCKSSAEAEMLLKHLETNNLIEPYPYSNRTMQSWWTTTQGNAFRKAKFIKPLNKLQASTLLNAFLERVKEVNRSDKYLFKIDYVGLFGSLTNPDVNEFMDVDLFINLKEKYDLSIGYLEVWYEHDKVLKFLRNRSPYLDLQDKEYQIAALSVVPIQLFPAEGNFPIHLF